MELICNIIQSMANLGKQLLIKDFQHAKQGMICFKKYPNGYS